MRILRLTLLYLSRVDSYGFEMPEGYESYEKMMAEYVAVLTRRSIKWSKLLQGKVHVEKNLKGVMHTHTQRGEETYNTYTY